MDGKKLYLFGIDGATGEYLTPPVGMDELASRARCDPAPEPSLVDYLRRGAARSQERGFEALPMGLDACDLRRAGWAVVFANDAPLALHEAARSLIDLRARQVPADRCKVLEYQPGESVRAWLNRHGAALGKVSPAKVPYYVLLVGGPDVIPFEFQYLLDVEYAVGRLAFDQPEDYRQYGESVAAYEAAAAPPNTREIVYWGTCHLGDFPTQLSANSLVGPLAEGVPGDPDEGEPIAKVCGFRSRLFKEEDARKANLAEVLHGPGQASRPAMLFTASHGLAWRCGDSRQAARQGALLCQHWPGFGAMSPDYYLSVDDIGDDARVHGLIAFLFACFGAGTPRQNDFLFGPNQPPADSAKRLLADRPFVAALPQRLLAHPQGGALAVIGHVERAWAHSIQPLDDRLMPLPGVGPQLTMYRNCVGRILSGNPVGHATKDISEKYASLSAELLSLIGPGAGSTASDDEKLVNTWTERNDVQNYILLGDPAVRLHPKLTG
jgi:hypothetical protein